MNDLRIVTNYRDTVFLIHTIQTQIAWNIRHGLSVLALSGQVRELSGELLHFEDILAGIPDIRTRNVICCRYALGMNLHNTADYIGLSARTVERICSATLRQLQE